MLAIAVAAAFAATFGALAQGTGGTTSSPGTSEQGNPPAGAPSGSQSEPSAGASSGSSRIPPDTFDQLDTNRDGKLSPGEATSSAARGSSSASGASFSDDKRGVGGSAIPANPGGVRTPKD